MQPSLFISFSLLLPTLSLSFTQPCLSHSHPCLYFSFPLLSHFLCLSLSQPCVGAISRGRNPGWAKSRVSAIRKRPKFRVGKIFAELFSMLNFFSCSLAIYGYNYKADILCNSLQQIVFSVTAQYHNTYLDNYYVLRCKTFGLLRVRHIHALIL